MLTTINLHSQSNNARTIQLGLDIGLSSSGSSVLTSILILREISHIQYTINEMTQDKLVVIKTN